MPALEYRASTLSAEFPFISESEGRTVILNGPDTTTNSIADRNVAVPQLYYMHNGMPVGDGFQSVDYVQKCSGAGLGGWGVSSRTPFIYTWHDGINLFDVAVSGTDMIARIGADVLWTVLGSLTGPAANWPTLNRPYFTKATINGVTYGLETQPGINSFRYTRTYVGGIFFNGTYVFVGAPAAASLRGIAAVAGYGVLWTEQGIFWSSNINPLDFTPSLITGAGGGALQEAKGIICFVAPATFGAVIYCVGNAVAMIATGNPTYPFTFKEIKGAGGYVSDQLIASDANSIVQFAYTTFGLQSLGATQAQGVLTEVTDFLSEQYFEDFDETTFLFTRTAISIPVYKKFTLISGRFLVISYGITTYFSTFPLYSHAIIYDVERKRYGKLKINHVDVWQWASVADATLEQIVGSIGFLGATANVFVPRMFHAAAVPISTISTGNGVFLLGKYQYVRTRFLGLDQVTIENVDAAQVLRVSALAAIDGKNTTETVGTLADNTGTQRRYVFDSLMGKNISILIIGSIDLSSMILNFHTGGRM